jgi:hypothetical protein
VDITKLVDLGLAEKTRGNLRPRLELMAAFIPGRATAARR